MTPNDGNLLNKSPNNWRSFFRIKTTTKTFKFVELFVQFKMFYWNSLRASTFFEFGVTSIVMHLPCVYLCRLIRLSSHLAKHLHRHRLPQFWFPFSIEWKTNQSNANLFLNFTKRTCTIRRSIWCCCSSIALMSRNFRRCFSNSSATISSVVSKPMSRLSEIGWYLFKSPPF